MISIYYVADNNAKEATHQYRDKYPDKQHPDHKAILHLIVRARMGQTKHKRFKKPLNNDNAIIVTIIGIITVSPYISVKYSVKLVVI